MTLETIKTGPYRYDFRDHTLMLTSWTEDGETFIQIEEGLNVGLKRPLNIAELKRLAREHPLLKDLFNSLADYSQIP